jgi:hypothetical protein
MQLFNESQSARLMVTFKAIDDSLTQALALLDPAGARNLFSLHKADATAQQFAQFRVATKRLRTAMREFLTQVGIAIPPPTISAVWNARTALMTAIVSLEDCGPKAMRGYGELAPEAAPVLTAGLKRLSQMLAHMQAQLAQPSDGESKIK